MIKFLNKTLYKQLRNMIESPLLYLFCVLFVIVGIPSIKNLMLTYYPYTVLVDVTQPYKIEKTIVESGEINRYLVEATKQYDFAGTVNRRLYSEECKASEQVSNAPSKLPKGVMAYWVAFQVPQTTQTECKYKLEMCITYDTSKADLEPLCLVTEEFKVVNDKRLSQVGEKIEESIEILK